MAIVLKTAALNRSQALFTVIRDLLKTQQNLQYK